MRRRGKGNAIFRKGQTATEYLVTYGWALLVLVAIMGILIATGIFSPANFLSDECNFQPDFQCQNFIIYNSPAAAAVPQTFVTFNATNGFGFPIKINSVNITTSDNWALPSSSYTTGEIMQGDTIVTSATFSFLGTLIQPSPGTVKNIYVSMNFTDCYLDTSGSCADSGLPTHIMSGRITSRVVRQ